jgi:hypothetical protein
VQLVFISICVAAAARIISCAEGIISVIEPNPFAHELCVHGVDGAGHLVAIPAQVGNTQGDQLVEQLAQHQLCVAEHAVGNRVVLPWGVSSLNPGPLSYRSLIYPGGSDECATKCS